MPTVCYENGVLPKKLDNGHKLYKQYTDNVCVIQSNPPDLGIVKQHIYRHTALTFKQEPDNPYDSRAVAIYLGFYKIGYLYRGALNDMANDFLRRGETVTGLVTGIISGKIKIEVAFYKPSSGVPDKTLKIKLSGNSSVTMQDNIALCSEGDTVHIDYDYDKHKYVVFCGDDIGYIPKSYEDKFGDLTACDAEIAEITVNDSGKMVVTIEISDCD